IAGCGCTPLEAAINSRNKRSVKQLVSAGANIHRVDSRGRTPLECAYRRWDGATVREIFELSNDVNDNDNGNTDDHDANEMDIDADDIDIDNDDTDDKDVNEDDVTENQLGLTRSECCSLIRDPPSLNREHVMQGIAQGLRKKHDLNLFTIEELAALSLRERDNVFRFSVDTESDHMLALLLSSSSDTSDSILPQLGTEVFGDIYRESTILHYAARTGKIRAVEAILRSYQGARLVEYIDHWGKTTLHSAVEGGELVLMELVKKLIERGAEINVQDQNGWFPLTLAAHSMNVPLLKELAEAGADLNIKGPEYWCPLRIAIERDGQDVVEYLVRAGADVEIEDEGGRTPLMSAVRRQDLRQVDVLVQAGANVNVRDHAGWCPLTVAIIMGSRIIVAYLLSHGADVSLKSRESCTALHMSARLHQLDMAGVLLRSGADLNAVNDDGETSLQFAIQDGSLPATLEILLRSPNLVGAIAESNLPYHPQNDRRTSWSEFSRSINPALDSTMRNLSTPMDQT
ncbi:MAG: hypothetical protein Q9160_009243, partial [Pyrenula sp. 1 TL-2023]